LGSRRVTLMLSSSRKTPWLGLGRGERGRGLRVFNKL
jgi:hypothetical protein